MAFSLRFETLESRALPSSNVVLDWDAAMLQAIRNTKTPPPVASRAMAMESIAVFDAIVLVNRQTHVFPVAGLPTHAPNNAIDTVSAAAAANTVLDSLFPTQKATFDAQLQNFLTTFPKSAAVAVQSSVTFGTAVGKAVLASRANDGSTANVPYTPGTAPGQWVPTPPAYQPALLPGWGNVTPFVLTSGSEFLPPKPPALGSNIYLADLAQVQQLGAVNSTTRTADQTQIAEFWDDSAGTATPPGHWNLIATQVVTSHPGTLLRDAQLFATLNVALADSGIACWNAKYTYNDWRPITAIRETQNDPTWSSLLNTPPFPTYVSGHSTFSSAAATVLTGFFGSNTAFTIGSDHLPGVTRSFTSFAQAAQEAGMSRIYGGIHYEFDNLAGLALGGTIGDVVLHDFLPSSHRSDQGNQHGAKPPAKNDVFFLAESDFLLNGAVKLKPQPGSQNAANPADKRVIENFMLFDLAKDRVDNPSEVVKHTLLSIPQVKLLQADAVAFVFADGLQVKR